MKDYERQTMNDKNTYRPSECEKEPKTEILSTPKPVSNDSVGLDNFLSNLNPNFTDGWQMENKNDWQKKNKPVVEEVKPSKQEDTNPLCNLKFDFSKLMGDF